MSRPKADRIRKLPQWAQDYINDLRAEIRVVEKRLDKLQGPVTDKTRLYASDFDTQTAMLDEDIFYIRLPDAKGKLVDVAIRLDADDSRIRVSAGRRIAVMPLASNGLMLGLIE